MGLSNKILQGTTPIFQIWVNTNQLLLTNVEKIQLVFKQQSREALIKKIEDCSINYTTNTVTYHFTEEETSKFRSDRPLKWQIKFQLSDGEIIGSEEDEVIVSNSLVTEAII